MRNIVALVTLLFVSACASTGMYSAPSGDATATIRIESTIDSGKQDAPAAGGWVMPGASVGTKVGLFTVDGDRLDKSGGDQQVKVDAGKHSVQIFADDGAALRFKKFKLKAESGAEYVVKIMTNEGGDSNYKAQVYDAAAPDTIIKEVTF